MTLACFESPSLQFATNSLVDGDKALVKQAIIAIEGKHTCNRGKVYNMPAAMIEEFGQNLNREIALGRIVSFFRDHNKSAETEFGKLTGFVEARRVTEADLPTPEAKDMLGKMALFAHAKITGCLDLVRSGAIKALSPGIDMTRKLIYEVSAVPVASMPGVALFRYPHQANFGYAEIKAENLKYQPLRDETIQDLDTLITALKMSDLSGGNFEQRQQSIEGFIVDLRERFGIPEGSTEEEIEYNPNPYAEEVIQPKEAGFSMKDVELSAKEKEGVLTQAADILRDGNRRSRIKPHRRTAGFGKRRGDGTS